MANIGSFDATQVAPREDFTPLPTGEYPAQIVDSDMKPTKKNDGQYLELTFEIADGEFKGRKVWSRLNLDNPNPKAVEIAQRDLSAICHAAGKLQIRDSQELHYKPMLIRVEYVEAGEGRDKPTNDIKAYKALAGAAPSAAAPAAPAAAGSAAPPWGAKAA
jgi:hypothetical protein